MDASFASSQIGTSPGVDGTLSLFEFKGRFCFRDGSAESEVTLRYAGTAEDQARSGAIEAWSNTRQVLTLSEAKPCDDHKAGPFTVYVDGGFYDRVPYLAQAVSLAQVLEPSAQDEVVVEDNSSCGVWHLTCRAQADID